MKRIFGTRLSLFAVLASAAVACAGSSSDETSAGVLSHLSASECSGATTWGENVTYATGAVVRHGGRVYQCVQGHTSLASWAPEVVPALWRETDCAAGGGDTGGGNGGNGGGGAKDAGTGGDNGGGGVNNGGGNGGGGGGNLPSGKLFVGYYQTWSDGWKANGADTVLARLPAYVNVVNLSFMQPDTTYVAGSLNLRGTTYLDVPYDGPTLKDAIAALHKNHPETKVMVAVGGATLYNWGNFHPQAVASFVNDFGLDGVDIDYEPAVPNCVTGGGKVSCPTDAEFIRAVTSMRAAMPRPKVVSIAGFSVGAYGEGAWANATPTGSSYTGITLALLKDAKAAEALDLINVMSYDASPVYDPIQALKAYQHYFKGKIAMGIEVPPEAWGGHVETIGEIDALADAVNGSGAAGLMLWSIQKQGPAQQFATEMCTKLGLKGCTQPML
jgi:chitinase